MFVSAGRRGMEVELSPQDLKNQTSTQFVPLTQE
jgi:prolyl-tRNA editing enzyme YbaK/EbsC (Cys-tRNA(Pro) deacylase)